MLEERYYATTQNRFYPDMSNVNKNITVEAKLHLHRIVHLLVLCVCWTHELKSTTIQDVAQSFLVENDVSEGSTNFILSAALPYCTKAQRRTFMVTVTRTSGMA